MIQYSNNGADSHACVPNNVNCAYINSVLIDENYIADSSGTKILGLSKDLFFPGTNSHVETANDFGGGIVTANTNYGDYGIYLTPEGLSKCNFAKGNSCTVGNCILGISDETNAHLSQCNIFGDDEIKLCCDFSVFITNYPIVPDLSDCGINTFEAEDIFVDENVNVSYSCDFPMDINIVLFDSAGNPVLSEVYSNTCATTEQTYDQYIFPKIESIATARIYTGECMKEKFFAVKSKVQASIPDNNLFLVLFVGLIVSLILIKKKD